VPVKIVPQQSGPNTAGTPIGYAYECDLPKFSLVPIFSLGGPKHKKSSTSYGNPAPMASPCDSAPIETPRLHFLDLETIAKVACNAETQISACNSMAEQMAQSNSCWTTRLPFASKTSSMSEKASRKRPRRDRLSSNACPVKIRAKLAALERLLLEGLHSQFPPMEQGNLDAQYKCWPYYYA
jgi:hypothetical protein